MKSTTLEDVSEAVRRGTLDLSAGRFLLETAPQARFLIPFGASIGFGVAIATAMLMLVVPALTTAYLQAAPSRSSRRAT